MKSKKGKKPAGGMSGKNKSAGMGNIDAGILALYTLW